MVRQEKGWRAMECPKCRQHNLPGSSYCEKCGFHLRSLQRQPQSNYGSYTPPVPSARPVPAPAPVPNYPGAAAPPPATPPPPPVQRPVRAAQPPPPQPAPPPPKPAAPPAYAHLRDLAQGRQLSLIYDRSLVGRESDSVKPEIDLADFGEGGVSRRHAQIVRAEGQVYVEDLSSSNGTFLNGERLQPGLQTPLKHQDEVRFGSLRFQYWHSQA